MLLHEPDNHTYSSLFHWSSRDVIKGGESDYHNVLFLESEMQCCGECYVYGIHQMPKPISSYFIPELIDNRKHNDKS